MQHDNTLMMQAVPGHIASLNTSFEFKRLVRAPGLTLN
jgi:hypothetical protein